MCVCRLSDPSRKSHVPCYIVICHWSALLYFSTLSHKRQDFRKKNVLHRKCLFWFSLQLLFGTFLILRRIQRGMIINIYWSYVNYRVHLSEFNETSLVSTNFPKIFKYQISWISVRWEPWQTWRSWVTLRNFSKGPQRCKSAWSLFL